MTAKPESLPYRACVGIMVLNRQRLVWVGRRADMPGEAEGPGSWWQMPPGGIDENEDPRQAALRELTEETNIRSVEVIEEAPGWVTYDLPPELLGLAWGGRFRGQKQKWFAVRFLGPDSEIDIGPRGGHPAEFEAWKWSPMSELATNIVPFKRAVYGEVVTAFGHLAGVG